jgi:hypothetical protein
MRRPEGCKEEQKSISAPHESSTRFSERFLSARAEREALCLRCLREGM